MAALAARATGAGQLSVAFFGDGASNQGTFHEGLNLAAIWDLPVVFICENNLYGVFTDIRKVMRVENIADRAAGYGIPGVVVDGMDPLAVYQAVAQAAERARAGEGPTLIEAKTYRWGGHHTGDPGTGYRSREEVEEWKGRDPIPAFRARLLEEGAMRRRKPAAMEAERDGGVGGGSLLRPLGARAADRRRLSSDLLRPPSIGPMSRRQTVSRES